MRLLQFAPALLEHIPN